jgi:hypothetical protein
MAFLVRLEDDRGVALAELDDPRGHLDLVSSIAGRMGLLYFGGLDPYGDHVLASLEATQLAQELDVLKTKLNPELLNVVKQDASANRESWGVSDDQDRKGFLEYLNMADVAFMKDLLSRFTALAEKAAAQPNLRLALYGD